MEAWLPWPLKKRTAQKKMQKKTTNSRYSHHNSLLMLITHILLKNCNNTGCWYLLFVVLFSDLFPFISFIGVVFTQLTRQCLSLRYTCSFDFARSHSHSLSIMECEKIVFVAITICIASEQRLKCELKRKCWLFCVACRVAPGLLHFFAWKYYTNSSIATCLIFTFVAFFSSIFRSNCRLWTWPI